MSNKVVPIDSHRPAPRGASDQNEQLRDSIIDTGKFMAALDARESAHHEEAVRSFAELSDLRKTQHSQTRTLIWLRLVFGALVLLATAVIANPTRARRIVTTYLFPTGVPAAAVKKRPAPSASPVPPRGPLPLRYRPAGGEGVCTVSEKFGVDPDALIESNPKVHARAKRQGKRVDLWPEDRLNLAQAAATIPQRHWVDC